MRSPFYIGVMRYNYRDESGTTFSFKPESEWIMFEEHHPQIVTHEQWSRVVTTMQSQRRGQPGHGKTFNRGNVHIFAGLVTCGYCGSLMRATKDRVRSDGSRPSIYTCASKRTGNSCPNKYISDLTIGPFVLNYIANIIRARKSLGASTSIEVLERKLLREIPSGTWRTSGGLGWRSCTGTSRGPRAWSRTSWLPPRYGLQ